MQKSLTLLKMSLLLHSVLIFSLPLQAQKFYPDDPLVKEPAPLSTVGPERRGLSGILEIVGNIFGDPGEQQPEQGVITAMGVNTLGEVPDGPWYVNRHWRKRMTVEELERGSGNQYPPSMDAKWAVRTVKSFGARPGMLVEDSKSQLYILQFDPVKYLEMSTGAAMVTSRFMHALGYHVPESYLVYFDRDQLEAEEGSEEITSMGEPRDLLEEGIDNFLKKAAKDKVRGYRAIATRVPVEWDSLLGPFQVFGTRSDDPNDIVPHEHRRDLRGLYVVGAWLNHSDMAAVYTLDVLVEVNDVPFIRHYLMDFGGTLGSGNDAPKLVWEGNEQIYRRRSALTNIVGMGIYSPKWMRARVPRHKAIGNFHYSSFDPEKWTTIADIAPFQNRLPDDDFWAAKQIMAFTDEDIRTIVEAGQYSDQRAADWLIKCLIERRDRIGKTYFERILPLERIRIENGRLAFDDLAVLYGFTSSRTYNLEWSEFDNQTLKHKSIGTPGSSLDLPSLALKADDGEYFAVKIAADDPKKVVTAFFRAQPEGLSLVGLDRDWPEKVLADSALDDGTWISNYGDLSPVQQELFEDFTKDYNQRVNRNLSAEEYFTSITISQRTTFYGITHALSRSELTDAEGNSLGMAIDLVKRIERIAGHYYGRGGDQQFRLYCDVDPSTLDTLEKSLEFYSGHENSVYHAGYPISYRQQGKYPSIQFSLSEDGAKADIDVDYRSSKVPSALFNGHLTSANSDIRAGNNAERHSNRWLDLIQWWRRVFDDEVEDNEEESDTALLSYSNDEEPIDLPPDRPERFEPPEVHTAAQEFLTDWLVRRDIDEADHFLSTQMLACVDTDDDVQDEVLRSEKARETIRDIMETANDELEDRDNLTEAINAVSTWDDSDRRVNHPYEGDFTLIELANEDADEFLCRPLNPQSSSTKVDGREYGTYYETLFRFKVEGQQGGVFGLLWIRVNGNWRIVSFEAFEQ